MRHGAHVVRAREVADGRDRVVQGDARDWRHGGDRLAPEFAAHLDLAFEVGESASELVLEVDVQQPLGDVRVLQIDAKHERDRVQDVDCDVRGHGRAVTHRVDGGMSLEQPKEAGLKRGCVLGCYESLVRARRLGPDQCVLIAHARLPYSSSQLASAQPGA